MVRSMKTRLRNAIADGKLVRLSDKITTKTISNKLNKPINFNSPVAMSVLSEAEWLLRVTEGYVGTVGGHHLEDIIAAVAPKSGWEVQKVGRKVDLKNSRIKKIVMLKTQPSTFNHSSKMGDEEKASQASRKDYELFSVVFFHPGHQSIIQELFGFSASDIDEIKQFAVDEARAARAKYEKLIKQHPLYNTVVGELACQLGW